MTQIRSTWVAGFDDLRLHVATAGAPSAPAIMLLHGWSQCHVSWRRQLESALAEHFFLVAPDLRGHGQSAKPLDPDCYNHAAPWAGDVRAVMAHFGLEKPILAGWSMGGKVLMDYLQVYGDAGLSGAAHVNSGVVSGRFTPEAARAARANPAVLAEDMYQDDLAANLAATRAFVRACTAQPLPAEEYAEMVGFNMLCPPVVRAASRLRDADYVPDARACRVPTLVTWGDQEAIMPRALFDQAVQSFASPEPVVFEGAGHAPFWEAPEQFNSVLADFAGRAFAASGAP